jgi:hypothetical protein
VPSANGTSATVLGVKVSELATGLWSWSAPHPDWTPDAFKDGHGWQEQVSSYALVEDDSLVLFDPLAPAGDEAAFWEALDGDVEHHGPPAILITVFWHARSSQKILDRYEGATVWAHEPAAADVAERAQVTNTFAEGDILPGGAQAVAMHHMDEAAFWLPGHRALVLGDSVIGYDGRAELCPASWLRKGESVAELRESVECALELQPERLLLTHGGPREPTELQL